MARSIYRIVRALGKLLLQDEEVPGVHRRKSTAVRDLVRSEYAKARRRLRSVDEHLRWDYLESNEDAKLHIGCGGNILPGWLNSDLNPANDSVLFLDATKTYPFDDGVFNCIFTEHMIEHVSYEAAGFMLKECFRVLENGGYIRVSTPDFRFLMNLYNDRLNERHREYIKWSTDSFVHFAPGYDPVYVVNNFVRSWGHQFIYDSLSLRHIMQEAGFREIVERDINESDNPSLRNIDNEDRMPDGYLRLESIVMEGRK